jgi:hypothetical protein
MSVYHIYNKNIMGFKNYDTLKSNSWEKFGKIKQLNVEDFKKACDSSNSMAEACSILGLNFTTFKKYATKYGYYKPNQSLKGGKKDTSSRFPIKEVIFEGKHPGYSRSRIKKRLFLEGYKKKECERCHNSKWEGEDSPLELEHIDGNGRNNLLSNLMILCPNCHALTSTYRGKNKIK